MCHGSKIRAILEKWLNNWSFFFVDVDGMSGGLIIGWSSSCKSTSSSFYRSSISVKLDLKDSGTIFNMVNL